MVIHSALPEALETAAAAVLGDAGVEHVPHGGSEPFRAAVAAAEDPRAGALLGPFRSADVNDALAVTAPAGLALIAPVATWAGVTHDDEPGCDDAARHDGTVLRLLARDTEVAARIAADVRTGGRRAFVVAGEHEYGVQLDGQLRMGGLPRADTPEEADIVVLCGLAGAPEIELAAALAPLPVVAFDGVQGAQLGAGRDVRLALPFAPFPGGPGRRPLRRRRARAPRREAGRRRAGRGRGGSLVGAREAPRGRPVRRARRPHGRRRLALARRRRLGAVPRPRAAAGRLTRGGGVAGPGRA
jgi:hypothetical protein